MSDHLTKKVLPWYVGRVRIGSKLRPSVNPLVPTEEENEEVKYSTQYRKLKKKWLVKYCDECQYNRYFKINVKVKENLFV